MMMDSENNENSYFIILLHYYDNICDMYAIFVYFFLLSYYCAQGWKIFYNSRLKSFYEKNLENVIIIPKKKYIFTSVLW